MTDVRCAGNHLHGNQPVGLIDKATRRRQDQDQAARAPRDLRSLQQRSYVCVCPASASASVSAYLSHMVFLLCNAACPALPCPVLSCPATAALHHAHGRNLHAGAGHPPRATQQTAWRPSSSRRDMAMVSEPPPVISPRRVLQDYLSSEEQRLAVGSTKRELLLASLPCSARTVTASSLQNQPSLSCFG